MVEAWVPVRGFEEYSVSSFGLVRHGDKILRPYFNFERGYFYISVQKPGVRRNFSVHRLVAENHLGFPVGLEVNHKDGNKKNNRAENLEWVTKSENMKHAHATGLQPKPKGNMKFSADRIKKLRALRATGYTHSEIASRLGMGVSTVTHVLLGSRRKDQ